MKKLLGFSFITLGLVVLIFSGCTTGKSSTYRDLVTFEGKEIPLHPDTVTFGHPFQLKIGQTTKLQKENLSITPVKVTKDARCASCYQSGGLDLLVNVQKGDDPPTSLSVSEFHRQRVTEDVVLLLKYADPSPLAEPHAYTEFAKDYTFTFELLKDPVIADFDEPFQLEVNQTATFSEQGLTLKPLNIVEECRNRSATLEKHCQHPGQIIIQFEIKKAGGARNVFTISNNETIRFEDKSITLKDVSPPEKSIKEDHDFSPSWVDEYIHFTFQISKTDQEK